METHDAELMTFEPAGDGSLASPYPFPFDKLQTRFIVTIAGRQGLHEFVSSADDGQLVFRALNDNNQSVIKVEAGDVQGLGLPVFHCFASRTPGLIVLMVNGDDYDVTMDTVYEVALPLFQAAHSAEWMEFGALAASAGFTSIELTNGEATVVAEISEFIADVLAIAS